MTKEKVTTSGRLREDLTIGEITTELKKTGAPVAKIIERRLSDDKSLPGKVTRLVVVVTEPHAEAVLDIIDKYEMINEDIVERGDGKSTTYVETNEFKSSKKAPDVEVSDKTKDALREVASKIRSSGTTKCYYNPDLRAVGWVCSSDDFEKGSGYTTKTTLIKSFRKLDFVEAVLIITSQDEPPEGAGWVLVN